MEAGDAFKALSSPHHGHVQAVWLALQRLDFANLIAARASPQRNLVVAMVAARILEPDSKLATTLPAMLKVSDADEDDLYDAMDWLLAGQQRIEKKLAGRHLNHDGLALYDLSSSYFEGVTCALDARGGGGNQATGTITSIATLG